MAEDGVDTAVYFFYPDPESTSLKAKFDVLRPMMQAACNASPVRCHFLDLRPIFAGHSEEYLLSGGLLPTPAGSTATAAAIWSVMQRQCIAQ